MGKINLGRVKGDTGAKILSTELIGQDANGGNMYRQTFDDGSTAEFTAPKGAQGPRGVDGTDAPVDNLTTANKEVPLSANMGKVLKEYVDNKHEKLVSGSNIKTVNGESLLGGGNITIDNGATSIFGDINNVVVLGSKNGIQFLDENGAVKSFNAGKNYFITIEIRNYVKHRGTPEEHYIRWFTLNGVVRHTIHNASNPMMTLIEGKRFVIKETTDSEFNTVLDPNTIARPTAGTAANSKNSVLDFIDYFGNDIINDTTSVSLLQPLPTCFAYISSDRKSIQLKQNIFSTNEKRYIQNNILVGDAVSYMNRSEIIQCVIQEF